MGGIRSWFAGLLLLAAGCQGDLTSSNGEFGRLQYSFATDYEGEQDELTALPLMTKVSHDITVSLTPKGENDADGRGGLVTHRSRDADVVTDEPSEESTRPGGFSITADEAGPAVVESLLDDELFDRITLKFDDPTRLDVVSWVRGPWEEDWTSENAESVRVSEGSQISFLAIPMARTVRLGGEFTPQIDVEPPTLAVPDDQVLAVQEGGVTVGGEPVTFYAIEAGIVTFTLREPAHGLAVTRTFEIVP